MMSKMSGFPSWEGLGVGHQQHVSERFNPPLTPPRRGIWANPSDKHVIPDNV